MTTTHQARDAARPALNAKMASHAFDFDAHVREQINDMPQPRSGIGILRFQARQAIFEQGDDCANVFKIIEGAVILVFTLPDGRRQILSVQGEGMLLGLPLQACYGASAFALRDVRVARITRAEFDASLPLQRQAAAQLQNQLLQMQDMIVTLGRRCAAERIASFVLSAALRGNPAGVAAHSRKPFEIMIDLSQTDLADHLGLTLETVCREFGKLKKAKILRACGRNSLEILDLKGLSELAGQSPRPQSADAVGAH